MGCTPIPADQLFDVILGEATAIVRKDYEGRIEALQAEVERLRAALREISETPNAGWMIARATLGEKQ